MKPAMKTNIAQEIRATGVMDALEKAAAIASAHFGALHGNKMDGPRNKTEGALCDLSEVFSVAEFDLRRLMEEFPPFLEEDRFVYPLTPDSVVWDVGAFEGDFATEIQRRYGCSIICFEPVFHRELEKKLESLRPKVTVLPHALGGHERGERWNIKSNSTGAFAAGDDRGVVEVRIRNIADVLGADVDLLKLNIEGMEFEVLEALVHRGLMNRFKNIMVQWHDCAPQAEKRYAALQSALRATHHLTLYAGWTWQNWRLKE